MYPKNILYSYVMLMPANRGDFHLCFTDSSFRVLLVTIFAHFELAPALFIRFIKREIKHLNPAPGHCEYSLQVKRCEICMLNL